MDKNQVTGLILLAILFVVYFKFFSPEAPVPQPETGRQETVENRADTAGSPAIISPSDTLNVAKRDSLVTRDQERKFGIFGPAASGEEKEVIVENEVMRVVFQSRGGEIKEVQLKEFKAYGGKPLILLDEESADFQYLVNVSDRQVDMGELYFNTTSENAIIAEGDSAVVVFNLTLPQGRTVSKTYVIHGDSYQIRGGVDMNGFENVIADNKILFRWTNRIKLLERDLKESRVKTTINYFADESFEDLGERSEDVEEETTSSPVKWAAAKQKFFTSGIVADDHFTSGNFKTSVNTGDTSVVKLAEISLEMPLSSNDAAGAGFTFYFGPNNFNILKKVAPSFEKNIYLGWPPVNFVNKYLIIPIFQFLERFIGNYGIIIFLLVIIIRIIISPLTYKSYISMAKTKILKPELDVIKDKYKDDMQKAQQEQMQLYQKAGVNPLSGCVPMLLQMPILFAMFYFFPNSIELRQEPFLWADDLSTYDAFISWSGNIPVLNWLFGNHISLFTVLMTASTVLYTWSNNQMTTVQGPMKSIGYLMPVVFMFVLNSFSAALTYYYFLSNIVSFGQQAIIKRFVNEGKIKSIMEENKLRYKSGKKSKFQLKLEEAMKAKTETATKTNTRSVKGK